MKISKNMHICFGFEDGHTDSCSGDSGGPIMCQSKNKKWEAHGIVS